MIVTNLCAAESKRGFYVLAKSGAVFHVESQKLVGRVQLNDRPPKAIMSVSFDPVTNHLYVLDQPDLERGGIFVIDAKSLRQKKRLPGATFVFTDTRDDAEQLYLEFPESYPRNQIALIDRHSMQWVKTPTEYLWQSCLKLSIDSTRAQELSKERVLDSKFYDQRCYSRDGIIASQVFRTRETNGIYGFRQISVGKTSTALSITNIRALEGECAMNTEKVICWPWRLSKRSRAELIDLATAQIHKVPFKKEDAPNGPADIFSVGKDYLVLQVGNNSTDFKYYIASDSTGWDLKPYDDLNKIKGEWLMNMYEIERR